MNIKQFVQRHALASYFGLAYGITWLGLGIFFASKGWRADAIQLSDIGVMLLLMLLGPSISGIGLTAWLNGRKGLGELFGRTTTFENNMLWQPVFAAGLWVMVASVVALYGTKLVRRRMVSGVRTA